MKRKVKFAGVFVCETCKWRSSRPGLRECEKCVKKRKPVKLTPEAQIRLNEMKERMSWLYNG